MAMSKVFRNFGPIAEGIETEKQLEFLPANGCRYGQGFFFHRPMPTLQTDALLAERDSPKNSGLARGLWQDSIVVAGSRCDLD